jgi:uncharacterized Zn-finger protein
LCDRSFTEKGHLKKHIQAVHEHIRPYQCPYCEKRCNRKPQVVNHAKAKHKTKITEDQGDLLMGIDNCLGAARSVVQVC